MSFIFTKETKTCLTIEFKMKTFFSLNKITWIGQQQQLVYFIIDNIH
jgi:hypothetical protein